MDLTALQHSPFLQSLGWAIANSLWQAAVLWIAYLLVNGTYRGSSAKFKNTLSTILLMSVFVWFCITLFSKYYALENSGAYLVQYYETGAVTASYYNWTDLFDKMAAMLPYLSAAYLLLLLFLSFRLINVYRFTAFIKSNGLQKPAAEWKLFTDKVAMHMGIGRKIKIWVSRHIDVPATIGFIKPVILIPLASVNQLSADQLEAIILHELSHIKRNDYLINLFISIIETILFFNPFVVLLAKIIKRERENCCDDFVIQYQYDRHAYASALLSLEQYRNLNLKLAIGATSGKKQLFLRIKRIMEINNNTNFNYGQKLAALLLITGVICSVAWLSPQSQENKKLQSNQFKVNIAEEKIRTSEKPSSIFTNVGVNVVVNKLKMEVKPLAKKILKTQEQLKELKDLNQKEIAQNEYKRAFMLLQESQKQVGRKKIDRLSLNKLFYNRVPSGAPGLYEKAVASYKNAFSNEGLQKMYNVMDLQKLQYEMEKAQFTFTFDCDIQEAVKLARSLPVKTPLPVRSPKNKPVDQVIEKVKTEVQVPGWNLQKTPLHFATTIPGDHNFTAVYMDSLVRSELKRESHRQGTPGKTYTTTEVRTAPLMDYAYAYGYGEKVKEKVKQTQKANERTAIAEGRQTASSPVVSGIRYRIVRDRDNNPVRVYLNENTVPEADNFRVQFKNGIVYINGRELKIQNQGELSQFSLKKKTVTKDKSDTDND
jgi:beta-lactamase regulating signal transducer with metallopeptidase domain